MPAYGPYETTREIASGHGFIVYSARKAGDAQDGYAVKVFALDSFISADAEDRSELDRLVADFDRTFNRSVELQKQAAAVSRCVAPILDVGREEGSAWYATRLYPRTVQKILEGRVALGKEWVYHIIRAIARGALDFKKACGRSHGEIQPSNVLIGAGQKVRDAEVVLSDPLPGEAAEAARYEVADLHAVGQIIYQLVRRREVEDASDHSILPLTPSAEWTSVFGKETDAWLSLCNRLLDPNLSTESYTLERLEADLARLEPQPAVTGKMLALAAAAVVAAIVGGVFVVRALNRAELVIASDPPGTQIQVTDASGKITSGRTGADGKLKLTLPKGAYSVRAEYAGLGVLMKEDVRVGGEPVPPFVFSYGKVVIDSQPRGAAIRIDGTNLLAGGGVAVTPHTFEAFKPGPVTFQLDLKDKGYVQANLSATIQEQRSTNLFAVLVLKQADSGTVEFDSNPLGVIYELNGKPIASNRAQIVSLPQGTYRFVGRYRDIWPTKETNVVLKANDEAKVKLYFERARISLDSQPSGANVYAGDRLLGVTPTESFLWPLGTARFRIEKTGFEVLTLVTNIAEDNARVDLVAPLVSTNGIILLTVEQAPAVVRDAVTARKAEYVALYLSVFAMLGGGAWWVLARLLGQSELSWLMNFLLPPAILLVGFGIISAIASAGNDDLEAAILTVPLLGSIYARLFVQETFYRIDTLLMFQSAVHAAMLEVINDRLTAKGLRALSAEERRPVFRELLFGGSSPMTHQQGPGDQPEAPSRAERPEVREAVLAH